MASFDHVHLFCVDLNQMIDLWVRGLGAEFIRFRKFGDADGAILSFDGINIFLKKISEGSPLPGNNLCGPNHLGIRVKNVKETIANLEAGFHGRLINLVSDDCAFIAMPDGLVFELMGQGLIV